MAQHFTTFFHQSITVSCADQPLEGSGSQVPNTHIEVRSFFIIFPFFF